MLINLEKEMTSYAKKKEALTKKFIARVKAFKANRDAAVKEADIVIRDVTEARAKAELQSRNADEHLAHLQKELTGN